MDSQLLRKPADNIRKKISEAQRYINKKGFDTSVALLINYQHHSGRKRLYLVNPNRSVVIDSFLVSHGCGVFGWGYDMSREKASFSNEPESHCSSLGHYKIGARAYSDWGIHVKYLMHGLDPTNSNALKRTIVLHGWDAVPELEPYPQGVPEGWGCPAVSNHAMTVIDNNLKDRKKPVLLWAY